MAGDNRAPHGNRHPPPRIPPTHGRRAGPGRPVPPTHDSSDRRRIGNDIWEVRRALDELPDEERTLIRLAHFGLDSATPRSPHGWTCRSAPSSRAPSGPPPPPGQARAPGHFARYQPTSEPPLHQRLRAPQPEVWSRMSVTDKHLIDYSPATRTRRSSRPIANPSTICGRCSPRKRPGSTPTRPWRNAVIAIAIAIAEDAATLKEARR